MANNKVNNTNEVVVENDNLLLIKQVHNLLQKSVPTTIKAAAKVNHNKKLQVELAVQNTVGKPHSKTSNIDITIQPSKAVAVTQSHTKQKDIVINKTKVAITNAYDNKLATELSLTNTNIKEVLPSNVQLSTQQKSINLIKQITPQAQVFANLHRANIKTPGTNLVKITGGGIGVSTQLTKDLSLSSSITKQNFKLPSANTSSSLSFNLGLNLKF